MNIIVIIIIIILLIMLFLLCFVQIIVNGLFMFVWQGLSENNLIQSIY